MITCADKDNTVSGTATHESTYQAANLGNVLLGGGVGIIVDAATGAMWKYPESVVVPMTCANRKTGGTEVTEVTEVTED